MTNQEIIVQYIPLVNFLGDVLGKNCEIVLHDFKNPDSSIIVICNGHLSKRNVGGPMTNLLLKTLQKKKNDYLTNYKALGPDGKEFFSSTYFIKNMQGEKIGAICINFDIQVYKDAYKALEKAFGLADEAEELPNYEESFQNNTEETVKLLINEAMKKSLIPFANMTVEDRILLIKELEDSGVFMYKGSVSLVAKHLKMSEPTVYRYISKIRNGVIKDI
jgi:predicted transcriptional regulator YheO